MIGDVIVKEPKLNIVNGVYICSLCLDGAGGECHMPGCVMWINQAPDLPIRQSIILMGGTITEVAEPTASNPGKQSVNANSAIALWREALRAWHKPINMHQWFQSNYDKIMDLCMDAERKNDT